MSRTLDDYLDACSDASITTVNALFNMTALQNLNATLFTSTLMDKVAAIIALKFGDCAMFDQDDYSAVTDLQARIYRWTTNMSALYNDKWSTKLKVLTAMTALTAAQAADEWYRDNKDTHGGNIKRTDDLTETRTPGVTITATDSRNSYNTSTLAAVAQNVTTPSGYDTIKNSGTQTNADTRTVTTKESGRNNRSLPEIYRDWFNSAEGVELMNEMIGTYAGMIIYPIY